MDVLVIGDQYYIVAETPRADNQTRVLKQGETFAIFDSYGDIQHGGLGEQGIYHQGTRFLSKLTLSLGSHRPMLLSSTVRQDNVLLAVDLTNPDVYFEDYVALPRGTLHIYRAKYLWDGVCHESFHIRNYGLTTVDFRLSMSFESDFADIFEVRGQKRERRGRLLAPAVSRSGVRLAYEGLDRVFRCTDISCHPDPTRISGSGLDMEIRVEPGEQTGILIALACEIGPGPGPSPRTLSYEGDLTAATRFTRETRSAICLVQSSNQQFNDWVERATADLHMMITMTDFGPYPYAGVPWFSTVFGRDGIITALQYLWVDPSLARGVLAYLAAFQATEVLPAQDAEPGKILHEARSGEMAALGEVPFRLYYGSADSTPLFLLLAAAYYERTEDLDFLRGIWPNVELALRWIDSYGDPDRDGFVEYFRRSPRGLVQQGWKDSQDSVFHADGALAQGPIALSEIQGYVYAAKRGIAEAASALGYPVQALELREQAEALRKRFESAFWCEELSTYAIALDGQKQPCRVRTSNAGQCLFSGIASQERAELTARTLMDACSFSGWGIRTVAEGEARYNPMSYHNGSIWPHDNAMIACGMARYGFRQPVAKMLNALLDASVFTDLHRLPELFCGLTRRPGKGPTLYPVACAPQSWAAAAVFMTLQACIGLKIDAPHNTIRFVRPALPESMHQLEIHNLRVADSRVDLVIERHGDSVGLRVKRREGDVEVVMIT